jgi:purine-cytosine permease-like protein
VRRAFVLATIALVALNDGNYYQATTAFQNVFGGWRRWKRLYSCLVAAVIAGVAGWYVNYGSTNGFVLITGLASITLPCATIIMVVDHFVLPKLLRISRPLLAVPAWNETGVGNLPAIAALVLAVGFGCVATGTIPQDAHRYWGPATPITWALAGCLYLLFAAIAKALAPNRGALKRVLGFSRLLDDVEVASGLVADLGAGVGQDASGQLGPDAVPVLETV